MKTNVTQLNSMNVLLGPMPSRKDVLSSDLSKPESNIRISVHRTMPFEWIVPYLQTFTRLWATECSISLSDYDPSLAYLSQWNDKDSALHIFWLDWRFYRKAMSPEDTVNWLMQRINELRKHSSKPILVNNWLAWEEDSDCVFSLFIQKRAWNQEFNLLLTRSLKALPDTGIIDLAMLSAILEPGIFIDSRNDTLSNYPFSGKATLAIARHIGTQLLPAVLAPRIKAIVLDLDDTLYNGVLGEDGIANVQLSEAHRKFQQAILQLKQSGILMAICSKNDVQDVQLLFEQRTDFPLQSKDFAAIHAGWNPKRENMLEIIKAFNIDPSAILFIDDSIHELLSMAEAYPALKLLQADRNAELTLTRLLHYPGLYAIHEDSTSAVRTADIQMNRIREEMKKNASGELAYLASLEMHIELYENCLDHAQRLYDLSRKTNQFNLTLKRMNEAEAKQCVESELYITYTVHLRDKLGDSGIIGALVCTYNGTHGSLTEVLFSCRALGRNIETIAFYHFLKKIQKVGITDLTIRTETGPRNEPARMWMQRYVPADSGDVSVTSLLAKVEADCSQHPAKVTILEK